MVMLLISLSGCAESSKENKSEKQTDNSDFIVELDISKKNYSINEDIVIIAKLKYVGNLNKITIYHAMSPFSFTIQEKEQSIFVPSITLPIIKETTLIKDEWYEETFNIGNTTYIDGKSAIIQKDLKKALTKDNFEYGYLPKGNYSISLTTEFYTKINGKRDFKFSNSKDIVIED